MQWILTLLGVIAGGMIALAYTFLNNRKAANGLHESQLAAEKLLKDAEKQKEFIIREAELKAKEIVSRANTEAERIAHERRCELAVVEAKLESREAALGRHVQMLERQEAELNRRVQVLDAREKSLANDQERSKKLLEEVQRRLEQVAGMTQEEAKRLLMEDMIESARREALNHIRIVEEEAREEADRRAKQIIAIAIERLAGDFVAERTVSALTLPSEEMKGRIIGREGRNIRAIEAATGVDIIIDDTPESVLISCHNPIRREIARVALERLISDGRIHPARIEEVVRKAEQEVEESIKEAGQRAIVEVGVHGIHPELVRLLGMLKYRYSYAQNVLAHSIEAAFICGAMAAELGLNPRQARRAALLHDIGKALTHEVEGSHALIGAEVARRYGESAKIVNAIAAHHEEVRAETVLAPLVDAADALSGARPGARREVLESYVKRLEDLEKIAKSFKGVEKCFAVHAGREMRIIVEPSAVSDDELSVLARNVARKVESEMSYPGQIRVTVIRETRSTEIAR